ncbi:MAG: VWA-like domain-containing protein [Thiolinea sp.]
MYDKEDNPAEGGRDSSENPLDNRDRQDDPTTPKDQEQPASTPQDSSPEGSQGQQPQREFKENAAGGEPPPPPLSRQEAEELAVQWQQRMAGAAQQAEQAGKLSGVMKRLVEEMLQPRLPWRSLLAHYMTAVARDDYSYTRPSTRRGEPAIFPTLKSQQINAAVALDVSGSVSARELQDCLSEINAIKGQLRAGITLLACDSELVDGFPRRFEPWEEVTLPEHIQGGGSTDFRPVFEWLAAQDQQPDILVYFTDAQGFSRSRCRISR